MTGDYDPGCTSTETDETMDQDQVTRDDRPDDSTPAARPDRPVDRESSISESSDPFEPDALDHVARSSLGKNLAQMLASQLATWTLALAVTITLPRYLGPSALGELRLAFSLWTMAEVFVALGTSAYLTLAVARKRSKGMALLGPILVLRLIVFVIAAVILGGVVIVSGADAELSRIMALYGIAFFFAAASEAISVAFIGLERMSVPATANVIARVLGAIASIGVVIAGGDATGVVAVTVFANLLGLVVLVRALRKITSVSFRGWRSMARPIVRGSVGFLVAAGVLVVYQQIDTVVISLLVDEDALGWYSTADQLFGTLLFPITILMASVFPVFGRLHTDDPPALTTLVRRAFSSLLVVAVPIGLGTMVIAQQAAPLLFGEDFSETGEVLLVYGPVILLTFGSILFGTIALATGRQAFWNLVILTGIALTVPLDLIFVPWADRTYSNGAIGGAMAYLVTESMMVIIGVWKITPYLLTRTVLSRTVRNLAAGGLMVAASWPLRDRFILLPIAVAAVVYIAAIFLLRVFTDNERQMLGGALARIGLQNRWSRIEDDGLIDQVIETESDATDTNPATEVPT